MFLMEHHAKSLLRQHGVAMPNGAVAGTAAEAEAAARGLSATKFAVKAQIGAGGRGLAGGVLFAENPAKAGSQAGSLLGRRLETPQTGSRGEIVTKVYVEEQVEIREMFYFAVLIDQNTAEPVLLGSPAGGVEFEKAAARDPEIVKRMRLEGTDLQNSGNLVEFVGSVGVTGDSVQAAAGLLAGVVRTFHATDALLIEINPLSLTGDGSVLAVDAKIVIDGNALPRHAELDSLAKEAAVEESERIAQENNVNFVELDGNIGLVVNGAGLGLATLDMVVEAGGKPANFMDIRTTAGSFQIARVIRMLIERPDLKVMLVNVHGGGMTVCDTIAEALNFAYSQTGSKVPIVFRAAGANAPWALSIMQNRRLPFRQYDTMTAAVDAAVRTVAGG